VTLVLLGLGFVVFYHPGEAGEERTEWFRRKRLGIWLIASGAVSLVLTLIVAFG
jgi:heme/copper-type cytochrome/quinol oxidase subunit 1